MEKKLLRKKPEQVTEEQQSWKSQGKWRLQSISVKNLHIWAEVNEILKTLKTV
jgi:hypothetical protein